MSRLPTAGPVPQDGSMSGVAADDAPAEVEREETGPGDPGARRLSIPFVPALAVLLVLLLGAVAVLWATRPASSSIRTDTYAEALQAARSNVVDMTSYDHLTFDDDLEQIRRVTTGDMREQSVAELDAQREAIVDSKTVVNTEIIEAGVTRVTEDAATALLLIQATQNSEGSEQTQVRRYRVEVDLVKQGNRWLLSGIRGR